MNGFPMGGSLVSDARSTHLGITTTEQMLLLSQFPRRSGYPETQQASSLNPRTRDLRPTFSSGLPLSGSWAVRNLARHQSALRRLGSESASDSLPLLKAMAETARVKKLWSSNACGASQIISL